MVKNTINTVREYFLSQNCELLESLYINGKTPMRYICICGKESLIRYDNFKSGQRCQACKGKKAAKRFLIYSLKKAQKIFQDNNCVLLASEYKSTTTPMKFICECGQVSIVSLGHFLLGRRCLNCRNHRSAFTRRTSIEKIREVFEAEKYILLSTEYINTKKPLKFRCPRGHEHQISLENWKRGGQRCRKCYLEDNRGANHPNWLSDRELKAQRDAIRRRCFHMLHTTLNQTNQKKRGTTAKILGYTCDELYSRLTSFPIYEKLKHKKWHLDHIYPIDAFLKHGITDLRVINALDNLQPMLGVENILKSNRYNKRKFAKYMKEKHNIIVSSNV